MHKSRISAAIFRYLLNLHITTWGPFGPHFSFVSTQLIQSSRSIPPPLPYMHRERVAEHHDDIITFDVNMAYKR